MYVTVCLITSDQANDGQTRVQATVDTLLHIATEEGHLHVVKYFLEEAKANPEKANEV